MTVTLANNGQFFAVASFADFIRIRIFHVKHHQQQPQQKLLKCLWSQMFHRAVTGVISTFVITSKQHMYFGKEHF